MVVTWSYSAPSNTATASGTGSTNFAALVAADTAGGWGKYTADATGIQIKCAGRIIIGDGTNACAFADTLKDVLFSGATSSSWQTCIWVSANSSFTSGVLDDATSKRCSRGCTFKFSEGRSIKGVNNEENGDVYLYASAFYKVGSGSDVTQIYMKKSTDRIWNCKLSNNVYFTGFGGDLNATSVHYQPNYPTFEGPLTSASLNEFFAETVFQAVKHWSTFDLTISNLKARGCTWTAQMENTGTNNLYLVNPDVDTWNNYFQNAASSKIFVQYTVNVVAATSATVVLKDNAGNTVFSVTSDGTTGAITQQTVSRGYYDRPTGGNGTGNTLTDYGPFTLTISKAGYIPYVHTGIVLDEKIDWRISLHPQLSGDATEADVATGKTFYKDDADTQLTGTLIPVIQTISGGVDGKTRVVVRREKDPLLIPSLMANAALLIENKRLRRKTS